MQENLKKIITEYMDELLIFFEDFEITEGLKECNDFEKLTLHLSVCFALNDYKANKRMQDLKNLILKNKHES